MSARLCRKWTGNESQLEAAERCAQWGPKNIECAEPDCWLAIGGTSVGDVLKLAQAVGWQYTPTKVDPHIQISKRYCPFHHPSDSIPFTDEFIAEVSGEPLTWWKRAGLWLGRMQRKFEVEI